MKLHYQLVLGGEYLQLENDLCKNIQDLILKMDQTILYLDPFINYYAKGGLKHSLRARYFYTNNNNSNGQSNQTDVLYSEYQFVKMLSRIEGLNLTGGLVMNQTYLIKRIQQIILWVMNALFTTGGLMFLNQVILINLIFMMVLLIFIKQLKTNLLQMLVLVD